jgi:enediyne biosynthesis protein E3
VTGRLAGRLLGIPAAEATFERRGFVVGPPGARERLELVGRTFLRGYHAALEHAAPGPLASRLEEIEGELRGFGYEGAAMALTLLDHLAPWRRRRLGRFLAGPAAAHVYVVHVGAGQALGRLGRLYRPPAGLDPLLRWLTLDGYGFHQGYFDGWQAAAGPPVPAGLSGYARRAFDQGLGRSLWFAAGGDVARLGAAIDTLSPARRADLWSGAGLACAYAGVVDRRALAALRESAGLHLPHAAQGAAFAAKARERAGNPTGHTETACEVLCGMSARAAAAVTDRALQDLPPDGLEPAYELWRRRIRVTFGAREATP